MQANPAGLTVAGGSVSVSQAGSQMIVQASHNAVLDWKSFNILAGEATTFQQPSAQSVVWNRIYDQNPSQIWGRLNANGFVVLMNQSGFYFGPNSVINVGGGPMWQFNGAPPTASIINYGQVKVANGGALFLVAEKIENHGVLMAPDGTLGLYAGKEVLLSDSPDGRGLSVKVKLPEGSIDNTGKLIADAGTIALRAQVVNQNGLVQANSILDRHGVIELIATEAVHLGAGSSIQAKGDATAVSRGGEITIKSDQTYADDPASRISVAGGGQGGPGGAVEVSAASMAAIDSQIDGQAPAGWAGGQLLIDPANIVIGTTTTRYKIPASGVVDSTVKVVSEPLRLNINTSFKGFANITLQATHNISLDNNTVWNLSSSTGKSLAGSVLRLEAGKDIVFGDGSEIKTGLGWSVQMAAGADFTAPLHVPLGATPGGIYFNGGPPDEFGNAPSGSGSLETADPHGDLTLVAASDVRVGSGHVRTVGGGSISITTRPGDLNSGDGNNWYDFTSVGYAVSPSGLDGIGTTAGGNVTLNAGRDLISVLPTVGAYGGGDVNLTAGRHILGRYLVSDGVGQMTSRPQKKWGILPA